MENNQLKCLVSDCYNEVGVLLPDNAKIKQKWLNSLDQNHKTSFCNNFICMDHFTDDVEINMSPTIESEDVKRSSNDFNHQENKNVNLNSHIDDEYSQIIQLSNDERFEITTDSMDSQDLEDYYSTCRLCALQLKGCGEYIYNNLHGKNTIAEVIKICLYPLKVSPTDQLPQYICKQCLVKLENFFQFHQSCMILYKKQCELISQSPQLININTYEDSDISQESQEVDIQEINQSINHSNNNFEKELRKNLEEKKSSQIRRFKLDKAEEGLLKILEGDDDSNKANDELLYTENIVIEMVNDDDQKPADITSDFLDNLNLPVTIKSAKQNSPKRRGVKRKYNGSSNSDNDNDDSLIMITAGKDNDELVVLPKGISVEVLDKFSSPLGIFSCTTVNYIFGMTFLSADNYLYDYGLTKQSKRYLRCINFKCPGRAVQKYKKKTTELENEIEIISVHNHHPFNEQNKEMQMCYNYLFKKMQRDKSYNIRIAYEEICEKNPDMRKMLPLRKILNEIFKYTSVNDIPAPSAFDEFYNTVEHDGYHKIHFTDNETQFYQDKFETADGSKAIIFANLDTIKACSNSKLLFVDASFNIEAEDFSYQLVTVLAWQPKGYYPIFYSFVNQRSYQIYKKIFDFLYWTLAPTLRPKEIVTDYEVNLYCALDEIYVDSIIGGSIFYFTQNLYKKICRLNLSKDLELNSSFRSIFNMLLMLPLLPSATIEEALQNIEQQAKEMSVEKISQDLFQHVHEQWIQKVTCNLFCVHRIESRINENVIPPFKKLRDLLLSRSKSKNSQPQLTIVFVIEKLIELEKFLRDSQKYPIKKTFVRDLCSTQRKIVLRAWNYIDEHPRININLFFMKVLGYIKCMENQLWIWGFYRYKSKIDDCLVSADHSTKTLEISPESEMELGDEETTIESVENENENHTIIQNGQYELQVEDSNEYVQKFIIEENGSSDGYTLKIQHCNEELENPTNDHQTALVLNTENSDYNNINKDN